MKITNSTITVHINNTKYTSNEHHQHPKSWTLQTLQNISTTNTNQDVKPTSTEKYEHQQHHKFKL